MGVAITLAQLLGMHRKDEYKVQSDERKLYKRVWWSCYIRDRLLAIAMCRPLRIKDAEFNTPPLTLEDFDIIDLSTGTGETLPDIASQTALAEMCIRATELCKLVAGVLELHFSLFPKEDSTTARDNGTRAAMMYLKSSPLDEQQMQVYDEQLQTWYRTLPPSCVYGTTTVHRESSRCIVVNAASLHITFWAVVSALHRPQLQSRGNAVSVRRVEEAAIEISRVDREMHQICLDQYLPSTAGISLQFPVFITNTKRLQKQKKTGGATAILESLFFCTKVVETLRESFIGGDDAIRFMTFIAQQANITLLFNPDSELCGIEYQGVHYSPGSHEPDLDWESAGGGFGDSSPLSESAFETEPQPTGELVNQSAGLELPAFDNIHAVDWGSLPGNLLAFDIDFEQMFGTLINWDYLPGMEIW
jgi:Fungal specific transcription factor domain